MITSEEIKSRLWDGANELRGSMDASRYKDYMLGLMFYKFLSDKTLETYADISGNTSNGSEKQTEAELVQSYRKDHGEHGENLQGAIQKILGYYVLPEYLYQTWLEDIHSGNFEVQKVSDSLNAFERTIATTQESDDFKGLFSSSTLDLTDTALGSNLNERSKNIKALIQLFADLDMVALQKSDVIGDAYEYLIGQFAMESGKKAGEFYTPRQVSEVMAQITAKTTQIKSIYDPTVGSGSLLLTVKSHLKEDHQKQLNYYGQEKNTATYNLSRMNLLLHGVRPEKMTVKNGDTLSQDWPEDPERPNEGVLFDAVVMNPPYSVKNWNSAGIKVSDPRFADFGVLPPDSKGDFAFLLHGLFHLDVNGVMAIVLPHGVLFRGGAEGEIRKRLLEKGYIDTIIGLPSNLFTNTGIPVTIMILKKNRPLGDPVLVIDGSKHFIKVGKQNVLQEMDIAKIVDTYTNRLEIEGYSHLATRKEISENEFNMNIPRYVEAVADEIPQDVDAHLYGGIPKENIKALEVLNKAVPTLMEKAVDELRPGYVTLTKPMDVLTESILKDPQVLAQCQQVEEKVKGYIDHYWNVLRQVNKETDLKHLKETMLLEIKEILAEFATIDVYKGYQVVAEIWKNALTRDSELIQEEDFYTLGRSREPNMVVKGSGDKKQKVQDGWLGTLVPTGLIESHLYSAELEAIENKKNRLAEVEGILSELLESAKTEDSDENMALYEVIKKNEDDEPLDAFEGKKVKSQLKLATKGTTTYDLLEKVDQLLTEKSTLNKGIKADEKALKDLIYERILTLTDAEIDRLVYEKWFGTTVADLVNLVVMPLKEELATLETLSKRYDSTLSQLDQESLALEKKLKALMDELVVM